MLNAGDCNLSCLINSSEILDIKFCDFTGSYVLLIILFFNVTYFENVFILLCERKKMLKSSASEDVAGQLSEN